MNGADYLIVGVLVFSVILGMVRGFVRESIALLAWLGGLWLAWRYASLVEPAFAGLIGDPPVSTWVARALIVIAVIIVGWMAASVLTYVLRHSSLSILVDRIRGSVLRNAARRGGGRRVRNPGTDRAPGAGGLVAGLEPAAVCGRVLELDSVLCGDRHGDARNRQQL